MRASPLLLALALTGCAHTEPRIITREVRVPVPVQCAPKLAAPPKLASDEVSLDASLFDLVRALLISLEQLKADNGEVRAALKACGP